MVALLWIGFVLFVVVMLALDLGVFNRKAHVIGTAEALRWTGLCVVLALLFTVFVYFAYTHHWLGVGLTHSDVHSGHDGAIKFLTGYIVEQSLSLDNIFVIALIFNYFGVPRIYQHRVLFWGILGALVMRGVMIAAGALLIAKFHWVIYIFGVLLLFTAVKMMFAGEEPPEPENNLLVKIARRFYPVTSKLEGDKFFVEAPPDQIVRRTGRRRAMTPMFICLLVIESTDVLFAVDSIPAIFAITKDPFIVFTSNVFAILCLRSMFFALSGLMHKFQYLKTSLVFLLAFIGVKMLLSGHESFKIDTMASLAIIIAILGVGVLASVMSKQAPPTDETPSI